MGHLWQGRFASCALDGRHLLAAVRYVERNPVRACLVERADAWQWSSARAHLAGQDDGLTALAPLLVAVGDWAAFLAVAPRMEEIDDLRQHERTGRPLSDRNFVAALELELGRCLRPSHPGRRHPAEERSIA